MFEKFVFFSYGDELVVVHDDASVVFSAGGDGVLARLHHNTLKDGFDSDSGDHLSVNVSIGISIISDNSKRVDEIIGQADDAMYKIKKAGKSNYGFLQS